MWFLYFLEFFKENVIRVKIGSGVGSVVSKVSVWCLCKNNFYESSYIVWCLCENCYIYVYIYVVFY